MIVKNHSDDGVGRVIGALVNELVATKELTVEDRMSGGILLQYQHDDFGYTVTVLEAGERIVVVPAGMVAKVAPIRNLSLDVMPDKNFQLVTPEPRGLLLLWRGVHWGENFEARMRGVGIEVILHSDENAAPQFIALPAA